MGKIGLFIKLIIPVLPDKDVLTIIIDRDGNKWIGTGGGGLVKFDDTNWTVYNIWNSDFAR
jgi:ligand-binding sensor domain-containing protein